MNLKELNLKISAISVLQGGKNSQVVKHIKGIVNSLNPSEFCNSYSELLNLTHKKSISQMIFESIHFDTNFFALESEKSTFEKLPKQIVSATNFDLSVLKEICLLSGKDLLKFGGKLFPEYKEIIKSLPVFEVGTPLDINNCEELYNLYKNQGFGFFASGKAFHFINSVATLAPHNDEITLADLKGYERQKNIVISNTLSFLSGEISNNILLYGDIGTGKSSTVKAVVNEYANKGLKIIELNVSQIYTFPKLYDLVAKSPFKFIVFIDDISFSSEDENFSSLKAFIEGGITSKPENMIIYATSNRRHMVKEKFSDRDGDDVHLRDSLQSAASLSARFGIEITFSDLDKKEYLNLVEILADESGITTEKTELFLLAERFATYKASRSPRTARQFINSEKGKNMQI